MCVLESIKKDVCVSEAKPALETSFCVVETGKPRWKRRLGFPQEAHQSGMNFEGYESEVGLQTQNQMGLSEDSQTSKIDIYWMIMLIYKAQK